MTNTKPGTRTVAVAAGMVFTAYLVWLIIGWPPGETQLAIDDVILLAVSVPPLIFAFLAARATKGRLRGAWWTLTVGLLSWNVGEVLWTDLKYVRNESPFPSPADAFFLFWPVAACWALLGFWSRGARQSYGRILLDGLIAGGSLFLVTWSLNMSAVYGSSAASRTEFVVAMAYPITDWILVTVAAIVLVNVQGRLRIVLTLMTLGLMSMALNTTAYAYLAALLGYSSAGVLNIGWVAGLLLITVAAAAGREIQSEDTEASDVPGWGSVWLPYAPLMLAAGVLAYGPPAVENTLFVRIIGALLVVAVLARQFLAVRENRQLLAMVSERGRRDPLTGLDNRARFADRLSQALRRGERTGRTVAVLSMDLDNFKLVNDTFGHAAGDEMLQRVGRRIAGAVLDDGVVARIGGDEFAIMVEGDPALPGEVARRVISAFDEPVAVRGLQMTVRPSIGRAATSSDHPDLTAEELLLQADMAMYNAKRSRSSAENPTTAAEPVQLLRQLRLAVAEGHLTLVYQPKFDLNSGARVGVEALLRWPHPELGLLTPDQFLPLVRHHGLIEPVTDFVVETALDDARRWRSAGVDVPVAINVFPPSLAGIVDRLDRALSSRGLSGSDLTIEITEDFLVDDIERIRRILSELRGRGIRIAIDDFGTGYSALQYLCDLPADEIKLDHSLISPLPEGGSAAAVARAIIDLAHALGKSTVAEGVENAESADWLRCNGCDVAQGHYFSPPMAATEIIGAEIIGAKTPVAGN